MEVGLKIKEYLEKNGISQAYVSRTAKINAVKLNLGLNGKRRFTFQEYSFICGVLGVNTDRFLQPRLPNGNKKEGNIE
ncbi:MAG: helix-turn-helix transcriptional regulator [Ruminococcus sp.]|nr:helix-turn-helix transcriptional regulator [Ruminococcus sp.]